MLGVIGVSLEGRVEAIGPALLIAVLEQFFAPVSLVSNIVTAPTEGERGLASWGVVDLD